VDDETGVIKGADLGINRRMPGPVIPIGEQYDRQKAKAQNGFNGSDQRLQAGQGWLAGAADDEQVGQASGRIFLKQIGGGFAGVVQLGQFAIAAGPEGASQDFPQYGRVVNKKKVFFLPGGCLPLADCPDNAVRQLLKVWQQDIPAV